MYVPATASKQETNQGKQPNHTQSHPSPFPAPSRQSRSIRFDSTHPAPRTPLARGASMARHHVPSGPPRPWLKVMYVGTPTVHHLRPREVGSLAPTPFVLNSQSPSSTPQTFSTDAMTPFPPLPFSPLQTSSPTGHTRPLACGANIPPRAAAAAVHAYVGRCICNSGARYSGRACVRACIERWLDGWAGHVVLAVVAADYLWQAGFWTLDAGLWVCLLGDS
ncbi:uncharacterized protein K452DRAFT_88278 [Aplosporella prunicola CBS 121167]|uniref:Uncharacterized protein n=1 Tax=Aplosporella prunicola CBS 121167 TaxID=1176127 RepID=A0A6A6B6X1_9PEZI|nr:uncharacterized protein K452DRAFT_88278 [Aplosporella prunicola CBS 121167]KAF2138551.1 hypothetical protein K452DRAFT_88278 [Aplosporella prunicola CBS 121167]